MFTQKQKQLTAHERIMVHEIFGHTMNFLEKYIEISGYYSDWEQKKQIQNNEITRTDIIGNPEKAKKAFSVVLFGLRQALEENPSPSLRNELKEEFYRWIGAVGINVSNCPPQLKQILHGFNEILEGRGEKIMEDVKNRKETTDINAPDYAERLNSVFAGAQPHLVKGREREKSLKGKKGNEVEVTNRFSGSSEQGEKIFNQISQTVSSHDDFHFFKQKVQQSASSGGVLPGNPTNSEIIQDVKNNLQNWRIDEITTSFDNYGRTKEEKVLVHQLARLNDYDREGNLNFDRNPVYRWKNFNAQERFEIKRAKNISGDYLTNEEIKWVVKEVKDNPSIWVIEIIDGQTWLIHSSAQMENIEVGTLIHNRQKFSDSEWGAIENSKIIEDIKKDINSWKIENLQGKEWLVNSRARKIQDEVGSLLHSKQRFTDEEWAEIKTALNNQQSWVSQAVSSVLPANYGNKQNYKLEVATSQNTNSQPQKDNKDGKIGLIATVSVFSALVIGGVILVAKEKLKKVKK